RRPTRQPFRGRLIWLGEVSKAYAQPLRRGIGDSMYTKKEHATREAPRGGHGASLAAIREESSRVTSPRVQACLDKVSHCERLASQSRDSLIALTYTDLAEQWRDLAKQIAQPVQEQPEKNSN